jgi:hypothetical protein
LPFGPILVYPRAAITGLKIVFWPHLGVGAGFQILDNQQVACGLKAASALIWSQNPDFETGSGSLTSGSFQPTRSSLALKPEDRLSSGI